MIDYRKCLECGHRWLPRKETRPCQCPACHSTNWDHAKPVRRSYDFARIEVGQDVLFEWDQKNINKNRLIHHALKAYERRTKRRFARLPETYGLRIKRLI